MNDETNSVSLLGLGQMGSALARAMLKNGVRLTVWNRSSAKAAPFAREGATVAGSLLEAVKASELVMICVLDYTTTAELLNTSELREALRGKTLLQLSTGTPSEARTAEAAAGEAGAEYLDGALMCYPSGIGTADATILLSGSKAVFDRHESLLRVLGGNATYVGAAVGAAAALDLALLDFYYGATTAMLHGFAICEAERIGFDVYVKSLPAFTPILAYTADLAARMIPERSYPGAEATNDIHSAALAHVARASRDAGLDPYPEAILAYFKKAQALGHGGDEIPAVYEAMRKRK